jgi:transposase InsO family protein
MSVKFNHELNRKGFKVSHKRLVSIMRKNGFYHKYHRKYVVTTDSNHNLARAENLVNREFNSFKVNEAWCGDITYIPTDEGWLYLASVVDLCSRCLVGYKFGATMDTDLICGALLMAIKEENQTVGTIFHSDQGSQYCSYQFQELLKSKGFRCSMSRRGQCWDNAVAESFWATLKRECLPVNRKFSSRSEGIKKIINWISYYNGLRPHSSLGMLSLYQYRNRVLY